MIRMYSKRILVPFVGVLQIAEMGRARAISADGENWAIQYTLSEDTRMRSINHVDAPGSHYSLVATIERGQLETHTGHPFLNLANVRPAIHHLYQAVTGAQVPFAAADRYEYWLLDPNNGSPIALLQSSVDQEDTATTPPHPAWLTMPAAQLAVPTPEPEQDSYVPPVNYRLQILIEERAGKKPRGAWFERNNPATDNFPPCLIREDWDNEEIQQLCALYIKRLAPRLLMMHGLSRKVRRRLETCAREYAFEVDRFHRLYPEVIDESMVNASRVEVRLRSAANKAKAVT